MIERERKFLVEKSPTELHYDSRKRIRQGYLFAGDDEDGSPTEMRLRRVGRRFRLTLKRGTGKTRSEVEVPISRKSGCMLWPLTRGRRIKKVRYTIPHEGRTVELDEYRGVARGLSIAEVEFDSDRESDEFVPPDWFGEEVTGREEFSNQKIATCG